MNRTSALFCFALCILLFSTISFPVGSSINSSIGMFLESIPGVSSVKSVDTFTLTQIRYSDLNIAIPVSFLLMLVIFLCNGKRSLNLKMNIGYASFLLFALIAGISAIVFKKYVEALKLIIYMMGIACFFSFESTERKTIADKLITVCVTAGVVNAVITIWQYGVMSGWVFIPSMIRLYRPDGIFGDSIISALFSNVCIAVLLLGSTKLKTPTRAVIIMLCGVAGIVTGARTFYYLLLIICFYLMLAKTRDVSLRMKVLLLCAIFAAVMLVISPIGQSLMDTLSLQDSASSRNLKRQLALEQFSNSPVFGIGTGQYAVYEATLGLPSNSGLHGTNPHNMYAQILCENGLMGFVPFILGLISSFCFAVKKKNALAVILLILYAVIGWSLGILYSVPFTSFFVVFICSIQETLEN